MEEKAKYYLEYLDKEMTIMGILSAFCVAVPSLFIERIFSVNQDSVFKWFIAQFYDNGLWCYSLASILMLFAAALFYKQRSKLAWYYGQISLEIALPDYTKRKYDEWLREADSWVAWLPYNLAFWISVFAGFEFLFAILSSIEIMDTKNNLFYFIFLPIILLTCFCFWIRRNSIKFKYEEKLPYCRIR